MHSYTTQVLEIKINQQHTNHDTQFILENPNMEKPTNISISPLAKPNQTDQHLAPTK
jgi:hypothetical protein